MMDEQQERFYILCTTYGSLSAANMALREAVTFAEQDADLQQQAVECVVKLNALREAISARIRSVVDGRTDDEA